MKVIIIGHKRIVFDKITFVEDATEKFTGNYLGSRFFEVPKDKGLIVTIHFGTNAESDDYIRLYMDEAEEFLAKFDAVTGVQ